MQSLVLFLAALLILEISDALLHSTALNQRVVTGRLTMSAVDTTNVYSQVIDGALAAMKGKVASGEAPEAFVQQVSGFLEDYGTSNYEAKAEPQHFKENVMTLLKSVDEAIKDPYQFQPFHSALREPFDYYKWGNDFLKPLVIMENSEVFDVHHFKDIESKLDAGKNVVILSNHQTEADPQVISILLEKESLTSLAEKMIFIAGHKVTNDPIAIPFSMGRNLLCIHSKKHIKNPPEDLPRKQAQNMESMKAMSELVGAGGKCFWVAPSGGRDRPNVNTNAFEVAPFDFKALDMFKLLAMQTKTEMEFYPMAMFTHRLVPPPSTVSSGLGEARSAKRGAVSIKLLGAMDGMGGLKDKTFTAEVEQFVKDGYDELVSFHDNQGSSSSSSSSSSSNDQSSDGEGKGFNQPAKGARTGGPKITPTLTPPNSKYTVEQRLARIASTTSSAQRSTLRKLRDAKKREYEL